MKSIVLNEQELVKISVIGEISHPANRGYIVDSGGRGHIVPGTGGITYNLRLGGGVFGWAGDHVEPEVSIKNVNKMDSDALNILACIGNLAVVVSGGAKGERGIVIGRHSGVEHVFIHFPAAEVLERLSPGDQIQIRAFGHGVQIQGFEDVAVNCIDPRLLRRIASVNDLGRLKIPVAGIVPAAVMGSGIGMDSYRGDYDIMTQDFELIKKHKLERLRIGDLLLLEDCSSLFGRGRLRGAASIGVVVHSDCIAGGHGPGVVNILAAQGSRISGRIDSRCNIADYLP